jgi:tRNA modification GTPase
LALLLVEPGGNLPDIVFKKDQLRLSTKADLGPLDKSADLTISTASGAGIDRLLIMIAERAASAAASTSLLPSRGQARATIKAYVEALERSLDGTELELRAEELRTAAIELGQITGQVATEELLGAIFSRFCIGK